MQVLLLGTGTLGVDKATVCQPYLTCLAQTDSIFDIINRNVIRKQTSYFPDKVTLVTKLCHLYFSYNIGSKAHWLCVLV